MFFARHLCVAFWDAAWYYSCGFWGQRMNTPFLNDLRDFHRFVGQKVASGEASLSPEDVLDQWRTLHPDRHTGDEEIAAIQEAIDDMENGDRGVPFEEFDRDFRASRNLPRES
jgi:hypothetical protein